VTTPQRPRRQAESIGGLQSHQDGRLLPTHGENFKDCLPG
jgi:hypothetical protein